MLTTTEEMNGFTLITVSPEQEDIDSNEAIKECMEFLTEKEETGELPEIARFIEPLAIELYKRRGIEDFTAFTMALNWKGFEHYRTHQKLSRLYFEMWETVHGFAQSNLEGEDLRYYLRTTD